jgi:LysM domain.
MNKSEARIWNNKIRRQRERRKNILLTLFTSCLIFVLSFTAGSFLSNAETDDKEVMFKYYKSILIENGDTLWSIAMEHKAPDMDTKALVAEIKKMNGLSSDHITTGNYLVVPYYSNEFQDQSSIDG